MKVTIGKIDVEVPGPVPEDDARRAAAEVTRRLKEAEERSTRIDSMGFALSAALSLALELQDAKAERDNDAAEMARALQRIADALKELVEEQVTAD